jgi:predicted ATPase
VPARAARAGALPIRRVERSRYDELDPAQYPASIPAVAQVLREGLDLGALTVLVGENGSGKSTLVEAVALAFGMSPEGGSTGARHTTRGSESPLHRSLHLVRDIGASRWGFFLRAETMHGFYTYLEDNPGRRDPAFHDMSHGESFLALLNSGRFLGSGLYVLDEPESALSFTNALGLVALLADLGRSENSQVLLATHSPVVAALPGATIYELDDDGIHVKAWDELDLVVHQRNFLAAPERYLRHLD